MKLREINAADWPIIAAIEQAVYPVGISEDVAVLRAKHDLSPRSCYCICQNQQVIGYIIAYPYKLGEIPALHHSPEPAFLGGNSLYIHDFALSQDIHGQGLGRRIISLLQTSYEKQGYSSCSLVAVEGAHAFWQKCGFRVIPSRVCPGYGDKACYMQSGQASCLTAISLNGG